MARGLLLAAETEHLPEPVYNVTGGVSRTRDEFVDVVKKLIPEVVGAVVEAFERSK